MNIREILFATDFSPCARQAFDTAVELSKALGAHLRIVHVLTPPPPIAMQPLVFVPPPEELFEQAANEAEDALDELAHEAERRGIDVETWLVEREQAASGVVGCAQERPVDLVVLGTHGRRGPARLLLGSVADHVARHCHCPVLTIRERETSEHPRGVPHRILVPFDFSAPSRGALLWAAAIARRTGAQLVLLHVIEQLGEAAGGAGLPTPAGTPLQDLAAEREARLREVAAYLAVGVPCTVEVRLGRPASQIAARANDGQVDWVVMSTRGLTGVKRLMFGSTAEEVVRLGDVPVFLVNPECAEPAREPVLPLATDAAPDESAPAAGAAPRSLAMRVSDLMHRNPQTATPGMSLQRAGRLMAEADCGVLPVIGSAGEVVGMLTDRDICLALSMRNKAPSDVQVRHVVTGDVWTCGADDALSAALHTMAAQRVRRLPVIDEVGRLVGILSLDDVLAETRALDQTGRPTYAEVAETLKAICTHPVPAVR